jgi:hypothetical protein
MEEHGDESGGGVVRGTDTPLITSNQAAAEDAGDIVVIPRLAFGEDNCLAHPLQRMHCPHRALYSGTHSSEGEAAWMSAPAPIECEKPCCQPHCNERNAAPQSPDDERHEDYRPAQCGQQRHNGRADQNDNHMTTIK